MVMMMKMIKVNAYKLEKAIEEIFEVIEDMECQTK